MFCGGEGDVDAGGGSVTAAKLGGLPPLQFGDHAEAEFRNEIADAGWSDDLWSHAGDAAGVADDPAQRGEVEVIHVRVGEQDGIDGREVLDAQTRAALSAQEDERAREDGIDEQVAAGDLDEKRGMADKGDAELFGENQNGQLRLAFERIAVALASDAVELTKFAEDRWISPCLHRNWMK